MRNEKPRKPHGFGVFELFWNSFIACWTEARDGQPWDRTFYSLSSETLENTDFFHLLHSNNLNCSLKNRDASCGATVSQLICPGDTNFYMNRYSLYNVHSMLIAFYFTVSDKESTSKSGGMYSLPLQFKFFDVCAWTLLTSGAFTHIFISRYFDVRRVHGKLSGMNTTTSEAGGCHYAGIALCSSRTRATRNTVCQLREDCYLPPVNGPLDGILSCSPISSSFSWFLTYSAIRLSFFPTVST